MFHADAERMLFCCSMRAARVFILGPRLAPLAVMLLTRPECPESNSSSEVKPAELPEEVESSGQSESLCEFGAASYHESASHGHRWTFFFQAEDGIRDWSVTGVQTCALPI